MPYVEQHFGGWYLRGGLRTLADELARRVTALGARIRTGTEVVRIETAGGAASGVLLADGGRLPADVVVANADAGHVYRDLLPAARAGAAGCAGPPPRCPASCCCSASAAARRTWRTTTSCSRPRTTREFDAIFGDPAAPVADPTIYVSVPDDPAVRPGRPRGLVRARQRAPARHRPGRGRLGLAGAVAARTRDACSACWPRRGLPVADRLLFSHVIHPGRPGPRDPGARAARSTARPPTAPASAFLRPPNRSPVKGVFLVGGSTHPGGGLPLVALSARIVDSLIGPA